MNLFDFQAEAPDGAAPREVYTVSRLNQEARAVLEASFPPLWVEGEVSNLASPRSGHIYFSLKDADCQVRCAMFRSYNRSLAFTPTDGEQVLVRARVSLYAGRGDFQLLVEYMEQAGEGALRRAFEVLKRRLGAEGLFDPAKKRPLPAVPHRIGVLTSPTGAAIRDILTVLKKRFPAAEVVVYPVPVQGAAAAPAIVAMLATAERHGACDVLLLSRGGGSLEDLWAFNEESVARAIAACAIPVVTGIGHEVDFTIADLVADQRAATPSAAAALVVPDVAEWRQRLTELRGRASALVRTGLTHRRERLAWLLKRVEHPRRRLLDRTQRLDGLNVRLIRAAGGTIIGKRADLSGRLARLYRYDPDQRLRAYRLHQAQLHQRLTSATDRHLTHQRTRLQALLRALAAVSPQHTLDRGYAIVTHPPGGVVLRSASETQTGERVGARLARGTLVCVVEETSRS